MCWLPGRTAMRKAPDMPTCCMHGCNPSLAQVNERLSLLEQRLEYPEVVVVGGGYAGEGRGGCTLASG